MTHVFNYSALGLIGNYARTLVGIVMTVVPLLLLNPISAIVYILVVMLILFVGYGIYTYLKQITRFEVTEDGIDMIGPVNRRINWEDLDGFSLKYYSTQRRRNAGWMTLRLKGGGVKMSIDSAINDFDVLLRLAFRMAERKGVEVNSVTLANLAVLGIIPSAPQVGDGLGEGSLA